MDNMQRQFVPVLLRYNPFPTYYPPRFWQLSLFHLFICPCFVSILPIYALLFLRFWQLFIARIKLLMIRISSSLFMWVNCFSPMDNMYWQFVLVMFRFNVNSTHLLPPFPQILTTLHGWNKPFENVNSVLHNRSFCKLLQGRPTKLGCDYP